ncbi:DUF6599 family protein [Candidatus Latescibacterota bacterium]
MKRILFMVIIAVIVSGCLFPVPNDLKSIIQSHDDFTLVGITSSYEALSLKKHIPADAGLYVEFGADSCLVAEFSRGNERYNVEIFSFLTPKGALGTYSLTLLPGSMPVDLGYSARKNDTTVQFIKGHNIALVSLLKGGTIEGAYELASIFEKRIEGGRIEPDLYQSLPKTNIVENSRIYFKGHRGFERRFTPELSKALQIQYVMEGTAAKYTVDTRQVDLLKLRFASRGDVLDGINSYLKTRDDRPIIHAMENRNYNIVVESDKSEVYLAEYGDIMYVMLGASPDKKGQEFFEYILRGGK